MGRMVSKTARPERRERDANDRCDGEKRRMLGVMALMVIGEWLLASECKLAPGLVSNRAGSNDISSAPGTCECPFVYKSALVLASVVLYLNIAYGRLWKC